MLEKIISFLKKLKEYINKFLGLTNRVIKIRDSIPEDGINSISDIWNITNVIIKELESVLSVVNVDELNEIEKVLDEAKNIKELVENSSENDFEYVKKEFADRAFNKLIDVVENKTDLDIDYKKILHKG